MKRVYLILFILFSISLSAQELIKEDFNSQFHKMDWEFNKIENIEQIINEGNGYLRLKRSDSGLPTTASFPIQRGKRFSIDLSFLVEDTSSLGDFTFAFINPLNKKDSLKEFTFISISFKKDGFLFAGIPFKAENLKWNGLSFCLSTNKINTHLSIFLGGGECRPISVLLDFNPFLYKNWLFMVNSYGTILLDNIIVDNN